MIRYQAQKGRIDQTEHQTFQQGGRRHTARQGKKP
jgi:hypothetical protein